MMDVDWLYVSVLDLADREDTGIRLTEEPPKSKYPLYRPPFLPTSYTIARGHKQLGESYAKVICDLFGHHVKPYLGKNEIIVAGDLTNDVGSIVERN